MALSAANHSLPSGARASVLPKTVLDGATPA